MENILESALNAQYSKELPADKVLDNSSRQVYESCFSFVDTKKPLKPALVHCSIELMNELGVFVKDENLFTKVMSGATPFQDFKSYAMCYGGHQFGNWAGQLGDGRAINIAELDLNGLNWKFQLKGAGPTPYSRGSDGLAVLRSSIREYLCSEAMHHLGVPTTRAISLVKTGDWVMRDILYNGNPEDEHGAIVCRISPSFIRFGSFEILSSRGDIVNLKKLTDYTIKHHFKHLKEPSKETYVEFFKEVVSKTKKMILGWQRVGFVHGVMNTDNMSILGLTIDYGPYGWLENYDPSWTPNTTDIQHRRYRFGNQASMALWNLTNLANALYPLIEDVEPLQAILDNFKKEYLRGLREMLGAKLGLYRYDTLKEDFLNELEKNMTRSEIDYVIFYRELCDVKSTEKEGFWKTILDCSYLNEIELESHKEAWMHWFEKFADYISIEDVPEEERSAKMKATNPKYVLRNYMAQLAIDAAEKGDYSLVEELYQLLLTPYEDQPEMEKWYAKRPDWAKNKVGCSMLSCSS